MNIVKSLLNSFERSVERRDRRVRLLAGMMDRLNVDVEQLARTNMGLSIRQVASRCLHCPQAARCEEWVATEHKGEQAPSFCQNACTFEEFRRH